MKGIAFVSDLVIRNSFIDIDQVKHKLGESASLILEYNVVKTAIMAYLSKTQANAVDCNELDGNLLFDGKDVSTPRNFRQHLLSKLVSQPCSVNVWLRKYNIELDKSYWLLVRKLTSEARLRELHWKILHLYI